MALADAHFAPYAYLTGGIIGTAVPRITLVVKSLFLVEQTATTDLVTQLADISQCARDVIDRVRPLLVDGTSTDRDLSQLDADLQGCLADIRDTLRDLAAFDAALAVTFVDGESLIQLWQWERAIRSDLVIVQRDILTTQSKALEVISGVSEQVRIVRTGETWQSIAAETLGDWREWPRLVEANGGEAGALVSGTVLTIPRKR